MNSGIMMHIAMQNMLHLPIQAQLTPNDWNENRTEAEKRDRLSTWIACNIVAQK